MKTVRNRRKTKKLKRVTLKPQKRRVIVHDDDGWRLISYRKRWKEEPIYGAIQWVEKQADRFERVALLIEAADHQFDRRDVDPGAAQHCAVAIGMLRDEFRTLRARLNYVPAKR